MPQPPAIAHPRIAVLGGGGILNAHGPALSALADRCTVTVVAEPNPARADAIRALLHPAVRIVADYRAAIADPEVDAVDILLPHNLHLPAAREAAEAGKHVLVEKVMARNVWECDRMIEACDCAGVTLTVCHDRRYHPAWAALKGIVESGALGRIFFWRLDHNQNVSGPPGHWLRDRSAIGGGAIMSCLTHQIDALRWYGGEVSAVTCMTRTDPARMEGEFLGVITASMRSGALAELTINWWTTANAGDPNLWYEMVHVCGNGGEAYTMSGRGTFVRLHPACSPQAVERYGAAAREGFVPVTVPAGAGHEVCLREWVASLRGEPANILTSGRECRGTVEVAEAAYRAERAGRTVQLPIEPEPWSDHPGDADGIQS